MEETNLYFVCADYGDGDSQDLLVRAKSIKRARKAWREHFLTERNPMYIGLVPLNTGPGPICWDAIATDAKTYKNYSK